MPYRQKRDPLLPLRQPTAAQRCLQMHDRTTGSARCIYREEREHAHIEVWDEDGQRSLWFDDVILQSAINLIDPAVLPNPVNRAMLAHLMFGREQRRVLLAGCGGGAIARWFNARSPATCGDAVEVSPTVARLAREYFDFPAPSSNWRLVIDDIRDFVGRPPHGYDFILVDLADNQATPDWVCGASFLQGCRKSLQPGGTLLVNLILEGTGVISEALLGIRQVFDGETLLLHFSDHDNLLVIAFNGPTPAIPDPGQLQSEGRRWGINFAAMAGQLTRVATVAAAERAR